MKIMLLTLKYSCFRHIILILPHMFFGFLQTFPSPVSCHNNVNTNFSINTLRSFALLTRISKKMFHCRYLQYSYIGIHRFLWFITSKNNLSIPMYILSAKKHAEPQDPSFGNAGGIHLSVR